MTIEIGWVANPRFLLFGTRKLRKLRKLRRLFAFFVYHSLICLTFFKIGVDFAMKVLNLGENTVIRLQLWDIAGKSGYFIFPTSMIMMIVRSGSRNRNHL